ELTRSFLGDEDHGLEDRLMKELPGILNWAIKGWVSIHRAKKFVAPKATEDVTQALRDLASPVGEFLRERCLVGPNEETFTSAINAAWAEWNAEKGRENF